MAYENIQLDYPNFCLGPVIGTFCSINRSAVTTIMELKNETGGIINSYVLSSNITNPVLSLEYVGPQNISSMIDGLTFFTLERVTSSICMISRWEIDTAVSMLNLKKQHIISDVGIYYFDAIAMTLEKYNVAFNANIGHYPNYIDVTNASRVVTGTSLYLGPSTDVDNTGAFEKVAVSHKVGNRVYLTSNLTYQYKSGDQVSFFNYTHLFSNVGFLGNTEKGTLFKIKLDYLGYTIVSADDEGFFKQITSARWHQSYGMLGVICGVNLIFIDVYNYNLNSRSLFMNNIAGENTRFPIEDVVFKDNSIYKLAEKVTKRSDGGSSTTTNWSDYNFSSDTILPYTDSIEVYSPRRKMIGHTDTTTIYVIVRDQFGVALNGKDVTVSIDSGDPDAELTPLDGQVTTDIEGKASVDYTSGSTYNGVTTIKAKVPDSSVASRGSVWVWNSMFITSDTDFSPVDLSIIATDTEVSFETYLIRQIRLIYKTIDEEEGLVDPSCRIFPRSFFSSHAGEWVYPSIAASEVPLYLPGLVLTGNNGPPGQGMGAHFFISRNVRDHATDGDNPTSFMIRQLLDVEATAQSIAVEEIFTSYSATYEGPPFTTLFQLHDAGCPLTSGVCMQLHAAHDLQISQMTMAHHTYWANGQPYTFVWTDTELDQFIFVSDAVPAFWSEKNPKETNIWIRLRPFAFDLDPTTISYRVRTVSAVGDSGYVDRTSEISYTSYDAGGGIQGVEITYDPIENFEHNTLVYIDIEISDTAAIPNRIGTWYWFMVIPDYKQPYLENHSPGIDDININVDTDIYFEVKDDGAGVNINSLDITVNSRLVRPQYLNIVKVNKAHYKVTYNPPDDFQYGRDVYVHVEVEDSSNYSNKLSTSYRFYTAESDDIFFTKFNPGICKHGIPRRTGVSFLALAAGSGVDRRTIKFEVDGKDFMDKATIIPVVYRIS